jgi:hypothetical protein
MQILSDHKKSFKISILNLYKRKWKLYTWGGERQLNISYLSRKLAKDKGVSKSVEIMDLVRRITEIISLFDKNIIKLYYSLKDLWFIFKYFENLIVILLFTEFNIFIIVIDKAKEKDIFVFYRAVYNFFENVFWFL